MNLNAYHDVKDEAKLAEIESSMAANGWVGAPIVTDGEYQALTGSHRLVAAQHVNDRWEQGEDVKHIEIPTIDIRDIWTEAGIASSIDEILTYTYCDEYAVVCQMIREQAPAIAESYGLDIH